MLLNQQLSESESNFILHSRDGRNIRPGLPLGGVGKCVINKRPSHDNDIEIRRGAIIRYHVHQQIRGFRVHYSDFVAYMSQIRHESLRSGM